MNQTKRPQEKLLLWLGIGLGAVLLIVVITAAVIILNAGSAMLTQILATEPEPTLPTPPANLYGPEDFSYEDGVMTCLSGAYMLGIDVNEWNGAVDWAAVKASGVEFVFIRLGGRGWGEAGTLYADGMAQSYYEGAKQHGLLVGAYFFSQAISVEEAREEALFSLDLVKDWELDLPLVYDWEYISDTVRTADMTKRLLTDCTKAFCQTVEASGYTAMVYSNPSQTFQLLHLEELLEYPFWLARYDSPMDFPYSFHVWQYSGSGQVAGISGPVDLNIMIPDQQTGEFLGRSSS